MELHYLSATEALKKFKNKTLSPLELTKAIIDRAKKIFNKWGLDFSVIGKTNNRKKLILKKV